MGRTVLLFATILCQTLAESGQIYLSNILLNHQNSSFCIEMACNAVVGLTSSSKYFILMFLSNPNNK